MSESILMFVCATTVADVDRSRSTGYSGNPFLRRARRAAGGQDREETSFSDTITETSPGNFIGKDDANDSLSSLARDNFVTNVNLTHKGRG